ncbi:xanthine dehydrogenase accessory protein XdhC [Georgenia muralis]
MDWLEAVQSLRADARPGVLVTVTAVRGHAPRDAGAKMVVARGATWDSVGGGNLEATVVDRARAMIDEGATAPETLTFALNDHAENRHGRQCCGGEVSVLLEPLRTAPTVAVFGVGHVGLELARILSRLRLDLHLVDSRAEQLDPLRLADVTGGHASVTVHHAVAPETVLRALPAGSHVLVMTHDHAEDLLLCDAALRRGDLDVGLIGSRAKWSRFRVRLRAEGHDDAVISTITCPIGLPTITGKAPAVIAVSVAADLLQTIEREAGAAGPAHVLARADRAAPAAPAPAEGRRA